jgi:hypothetical protein
MKNHLYRSALVAALGLAGATAAHAQTVPNTGDLVIGFTSTAAGVTQDYFVDIGQFSALTSPNDNLSSLLSFSTLQSVFGSALTSGNVNVGVIGADSVNGLLWDTSKRNSGPFTPDYTVANSTAPGTPTSGQLSAAQSTAGGLNVGPSGGSVGYAKSNNDSWSSLIAQKPGAKSDSTAYGTLGINSFAAQVSNPMATVAADGSGGFTVNLDLYGDNNNNGTTGRKFLYDGYFSMDYNTTSDSLSLVFDPAAAVPEPGTYGLLAGAGLLLVALRRQFTAKNA